MSLANIPLQSENSIKIALPVRFNEKKNKTKTNQQTPVYVFQSHLYNHFLISVPVNVLYIKQDAILPLAYPVLWQRRIYILNIYVFSDV